MNLVHGFMNYYHFLSIPIPSMMRFPVDLSLNPK